LIGGCARGQESSVRGAEEWQDATESIVQARFDGGFEIVRRKAHQRPRFNGKNIEDCRRARRGNLYQNLKGKEKTSENCSVHPRRAAKAASIL
jgi:hypothetical protein